MTNNPSDFMFPDEQLDILRLDHTIQTSLTSIQQSLDNPIAIPGSTAAGDDEETPELSSSLQRKLQEWQTSRRDLDPATRKHFYLLDTVELIQEYKQTLQTPIKIRFVEDQPFQQAQQTTTEKMEIVHKFLDTVREYKLDDAVPIPTATTTESMRHPHKPVDTTPTRCAMCDSLEFTESTEFAGILICLNCGSQETTMNLANSIRLTHNDSKRINICSKYAYDRKSHFLSCINQFQGRHKSGIEPEVIERLVRELDRYHLVDHDKTNPTERYRNVTKEHIFLFVKELKMSKNYGDINLIHHLITGSPLHDISHLTEKLLNDFEQFVQMHHRQFPNDAERKNFNYQHLLYQLLRRHKYACNPAEFNFLKTIERKYFHDEICRVVFENLGWNYSSLF